MISRSMRWPLLGLLLPVGLLSAQSSDYRRKQLERPQVIDGVSCDATGRAYAEFHLSGSLRSCPLSRDTSIAGHGLYAKSWITLDTLRALRAAWLSRDTELSGHLCHGTGYKGFSVRFRQDQSLELCFLARDAVIDGVPCVRGSFWTEIRGGSRTVATFHPDGSLSGCQLAKEHTADGHRFPKWTRIARTRSGHLSAVAPRD
jgi:hypothetical protein